MYLTFDLKTRKLLAFSDILGYEPNVDSEYTVYMDDYIIVRKHDHLNPIATTYNKDTGLEELVPNQYVLLKEHLNKVKVDIRRKEVTQKANELIQAKKNELAENRDIGYLTEKFRIARNVLKNNADDEDDADFETEVQLRDAGETKHDLAKKVQRKYKKMYRRMMKLDAYYSKFLKIINRRKTIDEITKFFNKFIIELEEKVR